jgi:hypothetical protein
MSNLNSIRDFSILRPGQQIEMTYDHNVIGYTQT